MSRSDRLAIVSFVGCLLGASLASACRTTGSPPADSSSPNASLDAASRVAPSPDAAPSESASSTPAKKPARSLGADGLSLGDIVTGAEPGSAHPKGTIVAVGWAEGKGDRVRLVEIDVATGAEVKRSAPLESFGTSNVLAHHEGESIHLVTTKGTSLVWLTANRELGEVKRVTTKPGPGNAGEPSLMDFVVIGGRAFVVVESNGAKVLVVDKSGAAIATHDCHANVRPGGPSSILVRVGGLAVASGLIDNEANLLACGVRIDGTGKPIVRKLPGPFSDIFVHDGVGYVEDVDVKRLDDTLAATGPAIPDPRRCSERPSDCTTSNIAERCSGLGGDGVSRVVTSGGAWVLRTFGCCGGPPGGVFVCE